MGFLRQVTGQKEKQNKYGTWISAAAARVLKEAGTQRLGTYIEKQQTIVAEWVVLRPILEICDMETGYEGGGRNCETRWREMADRNQLSTMLEDILVVTRERHWESVRRGKVGGGREVAEYDLGSDGHRYARTDTGDAQVSE